MEKKSSKDSEIKCNCGKEIRNKLLSDALYYGKIMTVWEKFKKSG